MFRGMLKMHCYYKKKVPILLSITDSSPLLVVTVTIYFAGPVAQLVERWTPCGESTRPGQKGPGFEARRALDVYQPPGGYGYGWWQAVARRSQ